MNKADSEFLQSFSIDLIDQFPVRDLVFRLLSIIETILAELFFFITENQILKDENNRLKGEKGVPKIRPKNQKAENYSSENERKISEPTKKIGRGPKVDKIKTKEEIRIIRGMLT